ncbi:hypothetical protein COU61_04245 [Candidatus Pacearchaeota archaeon CG10_big_fil_rev_8_21_14_0_10_35_13]|nr:MAG: hypothetical protein COU61_04245 [Candidatus Pacearchaeota archaeon CG10_big_fil_rev_8_21_14_0_10_35_13]
MKKEDSVHLDRRSVSRMSLLGRLLGFFILIFALVYYSFGYYTMLRSLIIVSLIFIPFDLINYLSKGKSRISRLFFKIYPHKKEEKKHLFGDGTIFLLSTIIMVLVLPKGVVIMSLIIFNFVDPAERVFGIMLPYLKLPWNKKKTWVGTAFGFFAGIIFSILGIYLLNIYFSALSIITASLIVALAGTSSKWDNLLIPWLSAIVLLLI